MIEKREDRITRLAPICYFCGAPGQDIHHIDGDHENNLKINLVTLCKSCHLKTHRKSLIVIEPGNQRISRNKVVFGNPPAENPLIIKREIFEDLPLYYRCLAQHLANTGRVIIIERIEGGITS